MTASLRELLSLSSLQTSMVLASMREPHAGAYIVQDVCEAELLDARLLREAWYQVSQRHPMLRCSVDTSEADALRLKQHQSPAIEWRELDWVGVAGATQQQQLDVLLREDWQRGFALDDGVPMRFALLRTSAISHTLIWTSHHVLLDGHSYFIIWREWFAIYDALLRGEKTALREPVDPRAYTTRVRASTSGDAEQYWRETLCGLTQTSDFLIDRIGSPGSSVPSARFVKESAALTEEETRELHSFAQTHGTSVNNLIQAAWALLLSRYSGRADVIFGVTRNGRSKAAPESEEAVGVLINTVPFRIEVPLDAELLPWLKEVRKRWLEMRPFQDTPLEKIQEWGSMLPGTAPFDSVVVYDHEPPGETLRRLGGNWATRKLRRFQRTDSPLTLIAYGAPLVTTEIAYDSGVFGHAFVSGILGHLHTLLRSFIARPHARLCDVRMLSDAEYHWHSDELNRTAGLCPKGLGAHQLFEQQADKGPDAPALEHAGRTISYAKLNQQANQLARFLLNRGIQKEDIVALFSERGPESVIAILAVLKAGGAFLPIDVNLPRERVSALLKDARPKLIVARNASLEKLAGCESAVVNLDESADAIASQPTSNLATDIVAENAAYAIFTSGSTGNPKAVVLTHRALVNHTLAVSRVYEVSTADRRLQFAQFGSDVFVSEVFTYLCCGACLVFFPTNAPMSAGDFLQRLDELRITITGLPSSWWNECVAALSTGAFTLPSSLRAVICGMERVNPASLAAWRNLVGGRVRWFNAYGPTETSPTVTIYEGGSSEWENASRVPIGKPIANARAYVLDAAGNLAPVGVPGELHIGGAGVARGYLNAPELTASKFVPDPFSEHPGDCLYKTGDLVYRLPDGQLVFLERIDRQVKIRGHRVELGEIETALRELPAIRNSAVILNEQERLVAYLSVQPGTNAASTDARLHLSRRLPAHMVPSDFFVVAEMPLTATGKIDREALLRLNAAPLRAPKDAPSPSTAVEVKLHGLWTKALGVSAAGLTDNFFELGGDSLRATTLITLIRKEFGRQISLTDLGRTPTIAGLAAILERDTNPLAGENRAIPWRSNGSAPPFFGISSHHRDVLCFRNVSKHLDNGQPFYALSSSLDETGFQTVEVLAARVCTEIRNIRSKGPYMLGGYCFGGVVAVEAARQLILRGEQVQLIALFDTPAPGYPKLSHARGRYWAELRAMCTGNSAVIANITTRDIFSHALVVARLVAGKALSTFQRHANARLPLSNGDLRRNMEHAARLYVPTPLNVPMIQFLPQEGAASARLLEDPRLGWRDLCGPEFHVHRVAGAHDTLLREPHAKEVARLLTDAIRGVTKGAAAANRDEIPR